MILSLIASEHQVIGLQTGSAEPFAVAPRLRRAFSWTHRALSTEGDGPRVAVMRPVAGVPPYHAACQPLLQASRL